MTPLGFNFFQVFVITLSDLTYKLQVACICFRYPRNVLLSEGQGHLYLYCSFFVCLLTVLPNTCRCREKAVSSMRVALIGTQGLLKDGQQAHLVCSTLTALPPFGTALYHRSSFLSWNSVLRLLSLGYLCSALRTVRYHSGVVSRSQLPKWLRLAMWLHCLLSVDNCAEEWLPSALPFPGMRETCSWLKTCSPVMTGNTRKKVTDFETLSCKTAWQVVPLNWPHFWQDIICFPHFCGLGKEEGSCFHSHKYFFSSYQ